MTCSTAKLLIPFRRPGDLAADDAAALGEHLATCAACAELAKADAFDAAIGTVIKAVPVPMGFRDALQSQAIAAQNAVWRTKWLGRATVMGILAAAVMLTCGIVANALRPSLDPELVLAEFDGRGSMAFDDWRAVEGVPPLPEDFDLRLMTFAGREPLAGRNVPAIRLRAGQGLDCVVYFVRDSQFAMNGIEDFAGSQGNVRVYRGQPGGYTILVVHTGNSLQPFLNRGGSNV